MKGSPVRIRASASPQLAVIERGIVTTMASLAMLPKQAADLGLQLKRLEARRRYDSSRLSADGQAAVDRLHVEAAVMEGG